MSIYRLYFLTFLSLMAVLPLSITPSPLIGYGALLSYFFPAVTLVGYLVFYNSPTRSESIRNSSAWLLWTVAMLILQFVHRGGFEYYLLWGMSAIFMTVVVDKMMRSGLSVKLSHLIHLFTWFVLFSSVVVLSTYSNGRLSNDIYGINYCRVIPCLALMMVGLFALVHLFYRENSLIRTVSRIVLFFGACVLGMSGSRESLVGFASLLPVLLVWRYVSKEKFNHFDRAMVVDYVAICLIAFAILFVNGRVAQGVSDIVNLTNGNGATSWGMRFYMWCAAFSGWLDKPIFGWGPTAYFTMCGDEIANGYFQPYLKWQFFHFHSEYFTTLASGGIVGIVGLLGMFLLLLWRAWANKNFAQIACVLCVATVSLFDCAFILCNYQGPMLMIFYNLLYFAKERQS